ncbi:MAG: sigma-70 family RNA polymerase sigma factor [Bacteroidota bacterium]
MDISSQIQQNTSRLEAFALRLTKNPYDAQDLLQETIFLALKNSDKFRGGTNFNAWIKTIMRNTFINNYRKNKRLMNYISQKISAYFSDKPQAKNDAESNIMVEELTEIIDDLDSKFKEPFMMYYYGYAYEEIAQKLELPLGTVKSRIFFARKHIKSVYKNYYGNPEDGRA